MTIQEIRRENLRWIIEHEYCGVQLKLASQVGLDPSALSRLVRANVKGSFGDRLARRIERSIGKTEGWLDMVHIFTIPGGEFHMAQTPDAVVVSPFGHRMVPVVTAELAAQWLGEPAAPYPMTERTQVDWVREVHAGSRTLGVEVASEDMRDRLWPGDVVFIDPDLPPQPGDIVLAEFPLDHAVVLRKYRPRTRSHIELAPLNEDYPTYTLDAEHPGRILGVMVEHRAYRRRPAAASLPPGRKTSGAA